MSNVLSPPTGLFPSATKLWLTGARPKTLPAAVVPVLVGTAFAYVEGQIVWWRALLALVVSLALQVGVNYANDYSDGIRGTDSDRVGPLRLVGSGLVAAPRVKGAAFLAFGVAACAGAVLSLVTSPFLLIVGVLAIAAAWFYTGGTKPYGYSGLGEVFVFVFFGLVAVVGTTYAQIERVSGLAAIGAIPVGLLAMALLVVNNLRDIPGDTGAGKVTLAVRLGDKRTRILYVSCVAVALLLSIPVALTSHRPWSALAIGALVVAVLPIRVVATGAKGPGLIPVLAGTGKVQIVYGLLLSLGLVLK